MVDRGLARVLLTVVGSGALVAVGLVIGGAALPVFVTGAFGLVTIQWQQSLQRQNELERQLASEKREHSKTYVSILGQIARSSKAGKPVANAPELVRKLNDWAWTGMLLASDEVLRAHARWTRLGGVEAPEDASMYTLPASADVILAMRRDIVPGTRLTAQEVLAVFVNEKIDDKLFERWEREKARMRL